MTGLTTGFTVFSTYQLETIPYSSGNSYGYATYIHSNYIQKTETQNIDSTTVLNMFFASEDEFKFLASGTSDGTGFTGTRIYALVQVVDGISTTGVTVTPDPALWKRFDVTGQITGHTVGQPLTAEKLRATLFKVDILQNAPFYDLTYLDQPNDLPIDDDKLTFGEEAFFFGTVRSDIKATAYITDIPIVLPLNEFNSTTNTTWDQNSAVQISEIGLYDDDGNLVAIGKFNFPIKKDATIQRTITFAIDF